MRRITVIVIIFFFTALFSLIIAGRFLSISLLLKPSSPPPLPQALSLASSPLSPSSPPPSPLSRTRIKSLNLNNRAYTLYFQPFTRITQIIPNFQNKESAEKIITRNQCANAINGGFYDSQYHPLGGLVINGEALGGINAESSLLKGFLLQRENSLPEILPFSRLPPFLFTPISPISPIAPISLISPSSSFPRISFLLQSGPIYIKGEKYRFADNAKARRSLLIQTTDNNFYLAAIFDSENLYSGPTLSDISDLLDLSDLSNLFFSRVLNLDGGSASFYFDSSLPAEKNLHELTLAGSVICVK